MAKKILIASILKDQVPKEVEKNLAFYPHQICTDSRKLKPGDLFIPISGSNFNGHQFINQALELGAGAVLYEPNQFIPVKDHSKLFAVNCSIKAYQQISYAHMKNLKNIKVIALTGSSGKTTVKELLALALSAYGNVKATEFNYNNEIGVPKTLLSFGDEHDYGIVEIGARRINDISSLIKLTRADVSILTCVGESHIGVFGSLDNIYKTKLEIFQHASTGNLKIGPSDDARIFEVLKAYPNFLSVGQTNSSNIEICNRKPNDSGMKVNFIISGNPYSVSVKIYHEALPLNLGYVLAVLFSFGLNIDSGIKKLESFSGIEGRYQSLTFDKIQIVDDSYNANFDSMIAGLKSFQTCYPLQHACLILGDMLELGDSSEKAHTKVGEFVAKNLPACHLITVGAKRLLLPSVLETVALTTNE